MKPLVFQSVGHIELKDHERLEHVLNAADTAFEAKRAQLTEGGRGGSTALQNGTTKHNTK